MLLFCCTTINIQQNDYVLWHAVENENVIDVLCAHMVLYWLEYAYTENGVRESMCSFHCCYQCKMCAYA